MGMDVHTHWIHSYNKIQSNLEPPAFLEIALKLSNIESENPLN